MNELTLTIDGRQVRVAEGTTIWEAARQSGIEIPALCHQTSLDPVGVCRMCVVDVGERVMAASCVRACATGMQVETRSAKVENHRRTLTRLLLQDHPVPCRRERTTADCELEELGRRYQLIASPTATDANLPQPLETADVRPAVPRSGNGRDPRRRDRDLSSPVIAVDHRACILCDRCVRACDDIQCNDVIGRTGKGHGVAIGFDLDHPMGESSCVSCGECVAACPTGALTNKPITLPVMATSQPGEVDSLCPYCGVGCAVTFHRGRDDGGENPLEAQAGDVSYQIVSAEGRDSPVNHGRLCVKGRYGWDYSAHPQRLTRPLIRREEFSPKGPLSEEVRHSIAGDRSRKPGGIVDYDQVMPAFREASWEEALQLVGRRFSQIREESGGAALAGFGSAKCSNEEAYLFQKLIRAGFRTNNVDHCTRLCHASSVAALMETIGSGAVTNVFADVARADVALVTGSNAPANHPVAATFIKQAAKRDTDLILVDVRRNELADFARHFAQIRPGTDVAFYNGLMHVLIRDELLDRRFIAERTEGFDALREMVMRDFSPPQASAICGVNAAQIEAIAETIGRAGSMIVFWGMGISQHTTGTDNARCLISLCLMTGNVGRPGTGLHPLRGQNNVQGASDAGLIPMVYPDYQPVADKDIRQKFEDAWRTTLDPQPGLTVVEIMAAALAGSIRGMYIMGENPFISDPNMNKVRRALSALEFLVVQDIFLTETAEFADVVLPASSFFEKTGTYTNTDRRVQVGRPVLAPPGQARQDWQIICDIGRRLGLDMNYDSESEVFAEFASLTENYRGMSHTNLGSQGKLWPCSDPHREDGKQILFADRFPTKNGKGKFVACPYRPADELPDAQYPLVLNTGRLLVHWHTGTMTRRSAALAKIESQAFAAMHPADLETLEVKAGDPIRVVSRRGAIQLVARADLNVEPGNVFIPFHFREAAANILTTDALDPHGKIPEFKFCAVRVERLSFSSLTTGANAAMEGKLNGEWE